MNIQISDKLKQIDKANVFAVLENKYSVLGPLWVTNQMEWMNGNYVSFKNHDKFLIVIYLLNKTLGFYARNFINLNYEEFYLKNTVEVGKFTISEISNSLNIPKESARRKINELESLNIIKKVNGKIIIDRSAYFHIKPVNTIKRICRFLAVVSNYLTDEKLLKKEISSIELEEIVKKNFSFIWKTYYDFQIPMLLNYKKIFKDLETFHIFGTCVVNQHLEPQMSDKHLLTREDFINAIILKKNPGINAMSISDITNIPRATVIRKLQQLVIRDNLTINHKKLYRLSGKFSEKLKPTQKIVLDKLAHFSTKVFNCAISK